MYVVVLSQGYRKALKRLSRSKDFDHLKLEAAIGILASGRQLGPQYQDHELKGEFVGYRECHIQNDILLVYKIIKRELVLALIDIGSHSELF